MNCPRCNTRLKNPAQPCPRCAALAKERTAPLPRERAPAEAEPPSRPATPPPLGEKKVHARYLFTAILPAPVPLEPGKEYRIGRDKKNEVYIPSSHVSRVHAKIRVTDAEAILHDEGSLNGTFVNGERVAEQTLRDGDRITLSELDLAYIEADEVETRAIALGQFDASAAETARREAIRREDLYGDLAEIGAAEVVQLIANNRKSGCLEITEAGAEGAYKVYFLKGSVVHAEAGELQGKDAALWALRVREGKFIFKPAKATKITMMTPIAKLLLEAMESKGDGPGEPSAPAES